MAADWKPSPPGAHWVQADGDQGTPSRTAARSWNDPASPEDSDPAAWVPAEQTPQGIPDATGKRWPRRLWLHILLFAATVLSTSLMVSPLYSACLIAILTAHEFGHYLAARYYKVPASLPYFIPAPVIFGTMGALIRMSPFVPNRRALFDIAAAGPIAGAVLAVPISFVGMTQSQRLPIQEDSPGLVLGDPLLFQFFERLLFGPGSEGMVLMINDVAFAGWVGVFVTGLNLIPIGQLDGGHVIYAVFGPRSVILARIAFGALAGFCIVVGYHFLVFLILLWFMGLRHGPTLHDALPLGPARTKVAVLLAAMFVLCFVPVPISMPF